jgi:Pectinacetylesterase
MRAARWLVAVGFALSALALAACGKDENVLLGSDGGAATGGGGGAAWQADAGGAGAPGFVPGEPISAPAETWTWVPFPGAVCRDGSATGIGVNLNPGSSRIAIYLQGGGACFNALSCETNPSHFGTQDFDAWKTGEGLTGFLDRSNSRNPLKDFNLVFVPYCTGDVHAGDFPNHTGDGIDGTQQFVGYANMTLFLKRIVPTVPSPTQVLLTGTSAGGFGCAANFLQTQRAYGSVPVTLLDDSGPLFSSKYMAPCLQDEWRKDWNLDATILKDCGAACSNPSEFASAALKHAASRYPNDQLALVSSAEDEVIRFFMSFGSHDCTELAPVEGSTYTAALLDLRSFMKPFPNMGTYYIGTCGGPAGTCNTHTWVETPRFYTTTVNGISLTSWVGALLAGSVSQVGP